MISASPDIRESTDTGCDVLLAVDAYMPWSGGSRVYYDNLYRRLSDRYNVRVRIETSHCDGDSQFDAKVSSESLDIHRRDARLPDWKVGRVPLLTRKIIHISRVARECAPAAIHCGDLFPQDFAGMLLRRLGGVPFLVYVHGDELSQTQHRRLQPRLRDIIYRSANSVVAANRFAYDRVVDILGTPENVTMITPGVDTTLFSPGPRPEWISEQYQVGGDPLILTIGRLVKRKGHETVLRALPSVAKRFPNVKYLVVGDGPERKHLETLASDLGLDAAFALPATFQTIA